MNKQNQNTNCITTKNTHTKNNCISRESNPGHPRASREILPLNHRFSNVNIANMSFMYCKNKGDDRAWRFEEYRVLLCH